MKKGLSRRDLLKRTAAGLAAQLFLEGAFSARSKSRPKSTSRQQEKVDCKYCNAALNKTRNKLLVTPYAYTPYGYPVDEAGNLISYSC